MFEMFVGALLMVVGIGALVFGIFRLKYFYDLKIEEYKAEKNLENQLELINQLPAMTTKMMDDMTGSIKKWAEVMEDM